jgi:hypothetical protein
MDLMTFPFGRLFNGSSLQATDSNRFRKKGDALECGTPFTFAVLDCIELVSRILGLFFATLYRLTYSG